MPSLRMQILQAVETRLETVRLALDWTSLVVNPREPIGEDQFNALLLMYGGSPEPNGLTGHISVDSLEFSVGLMVMERGSDRAEDLLDAGFVAVSNMLLDPAEIQLGGLAIDVRRQGLGEPLIGRARDGGRVIGGQTIDFAVRYLEREGDAETPGP